MVPELAEGHQCRFRYALHDEGVSDSKLVFSNWTDLRGSARAEEDVVEVECHRGGLLPLPRFRRTFAQVVRRERSRISGRPFGRASAEAPSVLLLGLDSMSRSNFQRQLPLTLAELRRQGFVEFQRHVKVADNTYANWLAFLAGKRGASVGVSFGTDRGQRRKLVTFSQNDMRLSCSCFGSYSKCTTCYKTYETFSYSCATTLLTSSVTVCKLLKK